MPACPTCGEQSTADARFCSRCGTALAPGPASPTRKTVTVLYTDLEGFTELTGRIDQEALRALILRYFTAMREALARHGAHLDKFIGDAILALFGVPRLHEDDAVRAARCALEMRATLSELNRELRSGWDETLRVRYGIATGEVALGGVAGQPFFALGPAVNLAQRLESVAPPDEVLICDRTAQLLGGQAQLEAMAPLALKGIDARVTAWRLLAVREGGRGPSTDRIVGRHPERRALGAALEQAEAEPGCRLVTVVGQAGVGKSALVRAFARSAEPAATTAVGRCLPYGDGITFWPLAEIVEQLAGRADESAIAALVGDRDDARWIAERVAGALGFAPGAAQLEEIQLAMRRVLEAAARRRPLILVIEDIHWAAPTLLDVIGYVASHATAVPLLIVCLSRPELDHPLPPAFGETIELAPLAEAESRLLLERLDPEAASDEAERSRLLTAAEGNPLFLEQLVALRQERGSAATLPATIQALLAARVDALPPVERVVIDCASVEGRHFHRGIVAELLPPPQRSALDDALTSLAARDLICRGGPDLAGEEGYGFSHILVRDAVYGLLPKARRAELHERFARSIALRMTGDREFGEIIGFHYEQAYRSTLELHPVKGPDHRRLGRAAARHLGGVGRTALARGDLPAAANLLHRSVAVLDDDEPALGRLWPELGATLTQAGRLAEAQEALEAAVHRASRRGESGHEAHALVGLLFARLQVDTGRAALEVRRRFDDLEETFTAQSDELGLDRLWRLQALVHWLEARSADADRAWQLAVEHARRAGDVHGRADALSWLASSAFIGPTPAAQAMARCEAIREELGGSRREEAFVLQPLAALSAMSGEFATARELLAASNAMLAELGASMDTAVQYHEAFVAELAGDPGEAEALLRSGYERLHRMGAQAFVATIAARLAQVVYARDQLDEALELTREAQLEADADDLSAQFLWRAVRGAVLARRGAVAEAEQLSAEALVLVERTDWLTDHADVLMARAEVLTAAGDDAAAETARQTALGLYERKGHVVAAERVRTRSHGRAPA